MFPWNSIKEELFILRDLLSEARNIVLKQWWIFFLLLPLIGICTIFLCFPVDVSIVKDFAPGRSENMIKIMKGISSYGNVLGVVLVCVAVYAIGFRLKRKTFKNAALAALLGLAFAGITDNVIRASTGRPRPKTMLEKNVKDEFVGPTFNSKYQSFPSAHCATAFGAAAALSIAMPPCSPVFIAGASFIAISRFYVLAHYPSDVLIGSLIGIWFGLAFGFASRKIAS